MLPVFVGLTWFNILHALKFLCQGWKIKLKGDSNKDTLVSAIGVNYVVGTLYVPSRRSWDRAGNRGRTERLEYSLGCYWQVINAGLDIVFENKLLRKICGQNKEELTAGWRKWGILNEDMRNISLRQKLFTFYSCPLLAYLYQATLCNKPTKCTVLINKTTLRELLQHVCKTQSTLDWYTHWRTGHTVPHELDIQCHMNWTYSATWIEASTARRKVNHFYYIYFIFYDIKCFNNILIVRFKNLYSCTFYT